MSARVTWIGVRPERKAPLQSKSTVFADQVDGLVGDHTTKPHRQVTLISQEALVNVASTLGRTSIDPAKTRRNILISGLDFNLNEGAQLQIGEAFIEITGPCLPCERMDETLGDGGRYAMANAGGLTARIVTSGDISVGDSVNVIPMPTAAQRPIPLP